MPTYNFDPTGRSSNNLISAEVHTSFTEPDVYPTYGPFYVSKLIITGVPVANSNVVQTLTINSDFLLSPRFDSLSDDVGKDIYSYILLTNKAYWSTISITYQAVGGGITDTFLASTITNITAGPAGFDRTSLNAWIALSEAVLGGAGNDNPATTNTAIFNSMLVKLTTIATASPGIDLYATSPVTTSATSVFNCESKNTALFITTGTWSGTIVLEASPDNTNWYPVNYLTIPGGLNAASFTANTLGSINTANFDYVRLRPNTVSSGTANIFWFATSAISNLAITNPIATLADSGISAGSAPTKAHAVAGVYNSVLPTLTSGQSVAIQFDVNGRVLTGSTLINLETTLTAGTAPSKAIVSGGQYNSTLPTLTTGQTAAKQLDASGRLLVSIGSGTTSFTIKAASTAAVAADTSIVVAVSPNTPIVTLADGTIGAGAAPTKSHIVGGIYNSTLPTLTNGQGAAIQLDSSGRQIMGTSAAVIGGVKLIDSAGTNTGAIKAASTPAVATDPALVVAISPNNGVRDIPVAPSNFSTTTITAGGSSQTLIAATAAGVNFEIFNPFTATENLYISTNGAASLTSIALVPGGYYTSPMRTTAQVNVFAATTGHAFTGTYW